MAGVTQFLMQLLCSYEIVNQKCSTAGQSVCIWAAPSFPEGFSSIHFSFRFLASFHFPTPRPIFSYLFTSPPTTSAPPLLWALQGHAVGYLPVLAHSDCKSMGSSIGGWEMSAERGVGRIEGRHGRGTMGGKLQGTDKNLGVGGRRKKLGMRACIGCSVERSTGVTSPTAVPSNETDWHIQHPPTGA